MAASALIRPEALDESRIEDLIGQHLQHNLEILPEQVGRRWQAQLVACVLGRVCRGGLRVGAWFRRAGLGRGPLGTGRAEAAAWVASVFHRRPLAAPCTRPAHACLPPAPTCHPPAWAARFAASSGADGGAARVCGEGQQGQLARGGGACAAGDAGAPMPQTGGHIVGCVMCSWHAWHAPDAGQMLRGARSGSTPCWACGLPRASLSRPVPRTATVPAHRTQRSRTRGRRRWSKTRTWST